jgi:hypothetical protein
MASPPNPLWDQLVELIIGSASGSVYGCTAVLAGQPFDTIKV